LHNYSLPNVVILNSNYEWVQCLVKDQVINSSSALHRKALAATLSGIHHFVENSFGNALREGFEMKV